MVDLNHLFSSSTLSSDVLHGASAASFNQQESSSSYPSFTDFLATAKAASSESQDETLAGTTMVGQFQTAQTSWQTSTSGNQFGNRDSNFGSTEAQVTKPANARTSSSNTHSSNTVEEDRYVASGSRQHSPAATGQATVAQSTTAKPAIEKSKHRKDSSQPDAPTAGESDSSAPNGATEENVISTAHAVSDPTALNSEQPTSPISQDNSTAAANTRKSKTGDGPGDLAFAVKVQGTNGTADSSLPTARTPANPPDVSGQAPASQFAAQLSTQMSSGSQKNLASTSSTKDGSISGLTLVPATAAQSGSGTQTETLAEAPTEEVAKAVEVPSDKIATALPLKSVQVQITGADNQRIDLRLMEKAGSLTMSVRSADGSLTKVLQQHLPELTTNLNDQQIRAEWWKPDIQKTDSARSTDDSANSGNRNSTTQDQSNQNKGNSGQQGGRSTRQTDWIEELSDLHKSSQNGTKYTWHL